MNSSERSCFLIFVGNLSFVELANQLNHMVTPSSPVKTLDYALSVVSEASKAHLHR